MTWKEFKDAVEAQGVKDAHEILYIDFDFDEETGSADYQSLLVVPFKRHDDPIHYFSVDGVLPVKCASTK